MGLFKRKDTKSSTETIEKIEKIEKIHRTLVRSSLSYTKTPTSVPVPIRANSGSDGFKKHPMPVSEVAVPKAPDPTLDPAAYLRSIYAVRDRSKLVFQKAKGNRLNHFDVDMTKFQDTSNYVVSIIKRDFAGNFKSIPPHGRWQHFDVGGRPRVDQMLQSWRNVDQEEKTRRLIDLFLVSVLLDAGAGTKWSYKSKESGKTYRRSEGLAVASLEMFKTGMFSSNPLQPYQVDSQGLKTVNVESLSKGMQVSASNPMEGIEGRTGLLIRLSKALQDQELFGTDARPGNMLGYLLSHPSTQTSSVPVIPLPTLWSVLMDGLSSIWPASRTQIQGRAIGDAWPCSAMPSVPPAEAWENIVPFHKLTQWLCYSLMVPMSKLMQIRFAGSELMTGLPEYRNGGLLVDTGLLTLKKPDMDRGLVAYKKNAEAKGQTCMEVIPMFQPSDDVIVEWRAVTVGFLDELLKEVNKGLGLTGSNCLSLAQMLEAGTWKGGRELAEVSRPNTKEPPIGIISDGTVF